MATFYYGGETFVVAHGRVQDAIRNFLLRTPTNTLVYPWRYFVYAFHSPGDGPVSLPSSEIQGPGAVRRRYWPGSEVVAVTLLPYNMQRHVQTTTGTGQGSRLRVYDATLNSLVRHLVWTEPRSRSSSATTSTGSQTDDGRAAGGSGLDGRAGPAKPVGTVTPRVQVQASPQPAQPPQSSASSLFAQLLRGGPNMRADCASQLMRELRGIAESDRSQQAVDAFPTQVAQAACVPIDDPAQQATCFSAMQRQTQAVDWSLPLDQQQAVTWTQETIQNACPARAEGPVLSLDSAMEDPSGCGVLPEGVSIDPEDYNPNIEAIADHGGILMDEVEGPCQDIPDECDPQQSNAGLVSRFLTQLDLFGNLDDQSHAQLIADLTGPVDLDAELCNRALGSSFIHDSHPRKRSLSDENPCCTFRQQLKMENQDCSQYEKNRQPVTEAVCHFIDRLSVDVHLSNDYWSGTTDTVKIDFNEGQRFITLMEQPWRNDSISVDVSLGDTFGADRVPLNAIQKIDLWSFTANESWYGMLRDPWTMETADSAYLHILGFVLRASCADRFRSGLAIEMNSFEDINEEIRRRTPDDKEKTWSRSITAANWTMVGAKPKEDKPKRKPKIIHDEFRRRRRGGLDFNATSA
ncbi:hypothetical protein CP532_5695 [Ophiocordyceps camponoti-leonardi (nom. inval.)]|nr:hypothetical protein CP532_5695 [Ophiocordyceps camponoti-leonardi (nom. inval.)]